MIYAIRVLCPECGADHKAEVDVEILTVQGGEQTEHRLVVKGERDVGAEAARWTAEAGAARSAVKEARWAAEKALWTAAEAARLEKAARLAEEKARLAAAEAARGTAEAAAWTTEAAGRSAGAAERMWQTEHLRELLERENANPTP